MRDILFVLFVAGVLSAPVFAGETATLRNGSSMHIDRHELAGDRVRLYTGGGFIEMPGALVEAYEPDAHPAVSPKIAPSATPQVPDASPRQLADAAADRYGLPRRLVRSLIAAESGFQRNAVSPKGAIGLMQLMPATAQVLGANPSDPAQNVDAGTRYLRDLLQKYNGLLYHALAAYNAGPGAVAKYNGVPPFQETIQYINRISRSMNQGN
jgi:soluble lytic murein transglycosylase-like protein